MPTPAELLARRRVLRAHEADTALLEAADADVAADALADLVEPPLLDLARQKRIGDRRPRRADDVELSRADRGDHRVRVREAADTDDRLARVRADLVHPRLLPVFGPNPGSRHRVSGVEQARRADLYVPQVDEVIDVLDEPNAILEHRDPEPVLGERVDREAHAERTVVAEGVADQLEHLAREPGAVLERAAVLVAAPVEVRHQELLRDRDGLGAVDQDQVEPGVARALGRSDVEPL